VKASVFKELGKPLVIEEIPKPEVKEKDVLMKVKASAICISDIYSIKGERPLQLPHIMGHEAAGIVAEVGSKVRKLKPGDRILGNAIVNCNECYYCKKDLEQVCENHKIVGTDSGTQGAFAEYYKLPEENMYLLPDEIPFDQATVITSPLASAYHGVRIADIQKGDTVVLYGGGAIGYHAMLAAMTYDSVRVFMIDTADEKLQLARKAGAAEVINALKEDPVKRVYELTDGRGAEVAIEAVGLNKTIHQAILSVRKAGRVVLMGAPWEQVCFEFENYRKDFLFKEIKISSSITNRKDEMPHLIELVRTKKIDLSRSVSLRLPFEKVNEGIEVVKNNVGNPIRVVLQFD
jgi:threonine dehydrogenase-like Zn-dependent dehydrogenase